MESVPWLKRFEFSLEESLSPFCLTCSHDVWRFSIHSVAMRQQLRMAGQKSWLSQGLGQCHYATAQPRTLYLLTWWEKQISVPHFLIHTHKVDNNIYLLVWRWSERISLSSVLTWCLTHEKHLIKQQRQCSNQQLHSESSLHFSIIDRRHRQKIRKKIEKKSNAANLVEIQTNPPLNSRTVF